MTEPNEGLKGLITPNTGDLVDSWGTAALNSNFQAIGGMLGGALTLSLAAATTIALTGPSGSITPGAGPTQQQNSLLRFTGSQTGTATVQFSLPGFYIIDNQCVGTTYPIVLAPASGTGTQIGAPWGRKTHVFFDGANVDYANPPDPASAIDLHGMATIPVWMSVCTKPYALIKDGSTYSASIYPALASILGSTFGGNGITTFGVPDERNRMRLPVDTNGPGSFSNRVTSAGSGIDGQTLGAAGGSQMMQAHTHSATNTITDNGHTHPFSIAQSNAASSGGTLLVPGTSGPAGSYNGTTGSATTGISVATQNATSGSGGAQNMPPAIVSFLALIKT